MTYIQPKTKTAKNSWLIFIIFIFILLAAANIFVYNRVVNLQHLIINQRQILNELRVANADLKNEIYQSLDLNNLNKVIEEWGLIKITNPDYLGV